MTWHGAAAVVTALFAASACSNAPSSQPVAPPSSAAAPSPTAVPTAARPAPRVASSGGVRDLSFVSADSGWALVGGQVLHTADGGRRWTRSGAAPRGATHIRFAPPDIGYAWRDNGSLWMSSDAGRSWVRAHLSQLVYLEIGAGTAWAITGPLPGPHVRRAAVGSTEWSSPSIGPNRSATLDVHGSVAYVTGQQGAGPIPPALVVWTSDGSSRSEKLPCDRFHRVVPFSPLGVSTDGVVVLDCEVQVGTRTREFAYTSSDAARTWTQVPGPPEAPTDLTATRAGVFTWGRNVWMLHGGTWRAVLSVKGERGFKTVGFVTDAFGIAVTGRGHAYRTLDGGKSWSPMPVT